jgi:diazepam-binding inhibitor (GABA receptor modulating acyl-CoA-binding protein)|tara:strand:- start:7438 stop:7710 length:273 start_codon:yes stop_codon:yes gene_type:complete
MSEKISQTLKIRFKRASNRVQNLSSRPSNEFLLKLYALYKQANDGDCNVRASGGLRDRAKWKAWNSVSGISQFDAMTQYCNVVDHLVNMD